MCMLIKGRKQNKYILESGIILYHKKQNQIGIYLFEYNVKHTVKMFENVQYTSEHRTKKVHSIEDDKENPFKREWRKC